MKKFLFILILLINSSLNAFEFDKCLHSLNKTGVAILNMPTSSSEFTSSTGECAALGYHSKENKKCTLFKISSNYN